MTNLALDLRFALRALRRSPLFSTVAILSVALGLAAIRRFSPCLIRFCCANYR